MSTARECAPERRESDAPALLALVQEVAANVRNLDERLTVHMHSEPLEMAHTVAGIMNKSFPGGDPEGHRIAHEQQMAAIADRAKFWKTMLFEVTKYGLLGVVGWLAFVVWSAFIKGPK